MGYVLIGPDARRRQTLHAGFGGLQTGPWALVLGPRGRAARAGRAILRHLGGQIPCPPSEFRLAQRINMRAAVALYYAAAARGLNQAACTQARNRRAIKSITLAEGPFQDRPCCTSLSHAPK